MYCSSESIGAIAGALAKAQSELVNPEKSLSGTITVSGPGGGERAFRYAPLSVGPEIVRISLGKHEIATMQTTAIDTDAGLVRLTTVLAHSSGEWVSSEWPVCPVSETASPRRMGAALTYARRYALFTLVGIAGEDDLDAPDLGQAPESGSEAQSVTPVPRGHSNGGTAGERGNADRKNPRPLATRLSPADSLAERERLTSELSGLTAADQLTDWAFRQMPTKNTLIAADAEMVEHAFQEKLEGIKPATATHQDTPSEPAIEGTALDVGPQPVMPSAAARPSKRRQNGPADAPLRDGNSLVPSAAGIDKSMLARSEPRRHRNKAHLKFVASHACLVCGREPADPHHLRFAQPRALGRKVSDEYTVPLCRSHHRELHRFGNEPKWWAQYNLDPLPVAEAMWTQTHASLRKLDPKDRDTERLDSSNYAAASEIAERSG